MNCQPKSVYHGAAVVVNVFEEPKFIEVTFLRPAKNHEFKTAMRTTLEAAEQHGITQWFFNMKKLSLHPIDMRWFETMWFDQLFRRVGVQHRFAVVRPESYYSVYTTENDIWGHYAREFEGSFIPKIFNHKTLAKEWLFLQLASVHS